MAGCERRRGSTARKIRFRVDDASEESGVNTRMMSIWLIVSFVVVGLVIAFGQPIVSAPGVGTVALVNGEAISRDTFEVARRANEALAGARLEGLDETMVRDLLDGQTLGHLIQRAVLAQEAEALGLSVSDAELRQSIRSDPRFQSGGRFDAERFRAFARRHDLASELTAEMRRELLLGKFQRTLISPVRVSRAAARETLRRSGTRLRLRYAGALQEDFRESVEVPDPEVQALLEAAPDRIQELYEQRRGEFQRPEEIRVRQILFRGDGALERARRAQGELRDGADFAALARKRSEDEATREQGGDLGFFPRGRLQPALEEAAFALEPGQVSEPIETERGIVLLRVEERRPELSRALEAVRTELARELARDEIARRVARETADKLAARLAGGEDFEKAARALGLEIEETPAFPASDRVVPGLGALPGLRQAVAPLTLENPVSTLVLEGPAGFYLVALLERREPDSATLDQDLPATRERLETLARDETLGLWITARLQQLEREQKIVRYPLYE
jgi:peptidyl-prolyl cis-trans isomerase D